MKNKRKNNREVENSQARAAGMANATLGRSRVFRPKDKYPNARKDIRSRLQSDL